MKSFATFLFESEFKVYKVDHFLHQDIINDRDVDVLFSRSYSRPDRYSVHFNVDDNSHVDPKKVDPANADIFKHVGAVVHRFIKEKNPASLTFQGNDWSSKYARQKHQLYGLFAKRLADKHGAKLISYENPVMVGNSYHTVKFRDDGYE